MLIYPQQVEDLRDEARRLASEAHERQDALAFEEFAGNVLEYDAMLVIARRRGAYDGTVWDNAGIAITEDRVKGEIE